MTRTTTAQKRDTFFALHQSGCFLMPNPWDAGSARMLESLGFSAIATTSSGYAWTTGRADYRGNVEETLEHLRALSAAVDIPVNADFESGFTSSLVTLRSNVMRAVETGIAALSIEDWDPDNPSDINSIERSAERLRVVRQAIDDTGEKVMLVGRTEVLLKQSGDVDEAIARLVAYDEAGADCLYAPGVTELDHIEAMVQAVYPKPLNVLVLSADLTVADYEALGVRRLSFGGTLARSAWGAAFARFEKLRFNDLSFDPDAISGSKLNEMFGPRT